MALGKTKLREAILAVANCPGNAADAEIETLGKQFRDAFLLFGSETPDNTACMEQVEVGRVDDGTDAARPTVGLRIANWPLSRLLNTAEGCPVPAQLTADYPDLTQDQWDAALRMATMLILAWEGEPAVENG